MMKKEEIKRHVLVTGPSGAGRSTAIRALEDMGYEAIDNLPLSVLPHLLDTPFDRPLALGVDTRNRDFSVPALNAAIARLDAHSAEPACVLYLACRAETLLRRFSETRRRHPLASDEDPAAGITRDFALLEPIRARANLIVDTTSLSPNDLRAALERSLAPHGASPVSVSVCSFSYKHGLPREVDMVFDCRCLRNPHWESDLRALDGRDPRVQGFLAEDETHAVFHDGVSALVRALLPAYKAEGKAYLTIGFGCTGGQHRSVAMSESLAALLAEDGWPVSLRHHALGPTGADWPKAPADGAETETRTDPAPAEGDDQR